MGLVALVFLALAGVAVLWPRAIAMPLAVLFAWLGASLLVSAVRLRRRRAQAHRDGGPPH